MWDWASGTTFEVLEVVESTINFNADAFNAAFTYVSVFGIISVFFMVILKMITRS